MFSSRIPATGHISIDIRNVDLSPLLETALDADLTVELQVRRLRLYWRKDLSLGAAMALFIWGEDL